ncbi:MAG: NADH-quinone oxidoreductase subunit H [Candidatus Hodarchaeales archaeon]
MPFDIPEAEAELVMGWRTELTGFRYMMSMATEYFILLIGAFIGVFLFWGGSYIPIISEQVWMINFIEAFPLILTIIIAVKLWIFIFLYIWIRSALPRVRIDQLLDIGWKRLVPLAIINIIFVIAVFLFDSTIFGWVKP